MEKTYLIYLHRNKINGKCYVGQTNQKPEARWGGWGQRYSDQEYFYRAIQKYGWDNFEHIILEENIPQEFVDEREIYWGGYYHALAPEGYSLHLGSYTNHIESELAKNNRSEVSQKNWENEQYRQKVIEGRKKMWEEASDEIKTKMLANLDRTGIGGLAKSKKVLCVETNIVYPSTREAERQTNVKHNNIANVCNGKRQTAGGFHWRYIEE